MATDIEITNQALTLLRADTISGFDEDSILAETCNRMYTDFAKNILSRHPWAFATKKALLSQNATAPVNEYTYAHDLPAECIRLWAVYDSAGVGAMPIVDYELIAQSTNRQIISNCPAVYAEYTYHVSEAYWPPYFVDFAIHAFAALLAVPVTDDSELHNRWNTIAWGSPSERERGGKFSVCTSIESQQKPMDLVRSSPLIAARFS